MVWIGKFKKEEQTIDYTDGGKNIPEIKTNYGVTKEGFLEFRQNSENKIDLDFDNNSNNTSSNIVNAFNNSGFANLSSNSSNNLSSGGAFDFLDNPSLGTSSSSVSPSAFNPPSPSAFDEPEIHKALQKLSLSLEDNANEIYRLNLRLEEIERKLAELSSN